MGPVAAAFRIAMLPLLSSQLPGLLLWTAAALGLLSGWMFVRLAPLRPVELDKRELNETFASLFDKRIYLILLLLMMGASIAICFGIHTLIRSKMPGGTTLILTLVVAHWPFARVMWKLGRARGKLFVFGVVFYLIFFMVSTPNRSMPQLGLAILAGGLLGTGFELAIRRRRCS